MINSLKLAHPRRTEVFDSLCLSEICCPQDKIPPWQIGALESHIAKNSPV